MLGCAGWSEAALVALPGPTTAATLAQVPVALPAPTPAPIPNVPVVLSHPTTATIPGVEEQSGKTKSDESMEDWGEEQNMGYESKSETAMEDQRLMMDFKEGTESPPNHVLIPLLDLPPSTIPNHIPVASSAPAQASVSNHVPFALPPPVALPVPVASPALVNIPTLPPLAFAPRAPATIQVPVALPATATASCKGLRVTKRGSQRKEKVMRVRPTLK